MVLGIRPPPSLLVPRFLDEYASFVLLVPLAKY